MIEFLCFLAILQISQFSSDLIGETDSRSVHYSNFNIHVPEIGIRFSTYMNQKFYLINILKISAEKSKIIMYEVNLDKITELAPRDKSIRSYVTVLIK